MRNLLAERGNNDPSDNTASRDDYPNASFGNGPIRNLLAERADDRDDADEQDGDR